MTENSTEQNRDGIRMNLTIFAGTFLSQGEQIYSAAVTTPPELVCSLHRRGNTVVLVSVELWLSFCTDGGNGNASSILISRQ